MAQRQDAGRHLVGAEDVRQFAGDGGHYPWVAGGENRCRGAGRLAFEYRDENRQTHLPQKPKGSPLGEPSLTLYPEIGSVCLGACQLRLALEVGAHHPDGHGLAAQGCGRLFRCRHRVPVEQIEQLALLRRRCM